MTEKIIKIPAMIRKGKYIIFISIESMLMHLSASKVAMYPSGHLEMH